MNTYINPNAEESKGNYEANMHSYQNKNEVRFKEQFLWRISCWAWVNIYLFGEIGLTRLFSIQGILWLIIGTILILTLWAFLASAMERISLMIWERVFVWRMIECVLMYLVANTLFNNVFKLMF